MVGLAGIEPAAYRLGIRCLKKKSLKSLTSLISIVFSNLESIFSDAQLKENLPNKFANFLYYFTKASLEKQVFQYF